MEINAEIRTYKTAGLKKWLPYICLFLIILFGYYLLRTNQPKEKLSYNRVSKNESVFINDTSSIRVIDSLRNFTIAAIKQIHEYEELKKIYQKQEAEIIYKPIVDSSMVISLRNKLNSANNEISRLKGELDIIESKRNIKPNVTTYVQPAIQLPDENSIVITLDGSSRKGELFIPNDLKIYLIPYSKRVKRLMNYEPSCNLSGIEAVYYKGIYFFNNVSSGKYLIKICTYFGNYKLIEKGVGKFNVTMELSPPVQ